MTEFLHFWIQSSEFNYADENIAHCSCGHRGEEPEYDGRETAALLQRVRHKLELETNLREVWSFTITVSHLRHYKDIMLNRHWPTMVSSPEIGTPTPKPYETGGLRMQSEGTGQDTRIAVVEGEQRAGRAAIAAGLQFSSLHVTAPHHGLCCWLASAVNQRYCQHYTHPTSTSSMLANILQALLMHLKLYSIVFLNLSTKCNLYGRQGILLR